VPGVGRDARHSKVNLTITLNKTCMTTNSTGPGTSRFARSGSARTSHVVEYLERKFLETISMLPRSKRAIILAEPLWTITFGLSTAYASLYQEKLGLSAVQIGLLSSVGLVSYAFWSLLGGPLADRLGRKRALFIFDFTAWSLAMLIWAVSRNFWFFLAAAIANGTVGAAEVSFSCLLVEDIRPEERLTVFSWLQVIDLMNGLVAPIAGVLVGLYGVVVASRSLYTFAFVIMTTMFVVRNRYMQETTVGLRRISEARGTSIFRSFRGIPSAIAVVLRDPVLRRLFYVSIVNRIRYGVLGVYLPLFLTKRVGLVPSRVAIYPSIMSLAMFMMTVLVLPRLGYSRAMPRLTKGLLFVAAGLLVIGLAPGGTLGAVQAAIGVALVGGATGIVNPYHGTSWHNSLADESRAQVMSVTAVVRTVLAAPSGVLAGLLFAKSPVYFMLALSALIFTGAVVMATLPRPVVAAGASSGAR